MSNLTITATTDLSTLPAKVRRDITGAYAALAALEPNAARLRKAAERVGTLRRHGISIRGIVAILSVEGAGTLPTGKTTIERLGYVADAIGGEWPDTGDSADGILMALHRISQIGKAGDVARAAELGRATANGVDAFSAVDAVRIELNGTQHRDLTTAPARPVGGTPAAVTTPDADDDDDDDTTPAAPVTPRAESERLTSSSTLALISELARRAGARGFTPDDVLTEAFDALAVAWETAAATVDA